MSANCSNPTSSRTTAPCLRSSVQARAAALRLIQPLAPTLQKLHLNSRAARPERNPEARGRRFGLIKRPRQAPKWAARAGRGRLRTVDPPAGGRAPPQGDKLGRGRSTRPEALVLPPRQAACPESPRFRPLSWARRKRPNYVGRSAESDSRAGRRMRGECGMGAAERGPSRGFRPTPIVSAANPDAAEARPRFAQCWSARPLAT